MALSPVVTQAMDAAARPASRAASSPLKTLASGPASSDGTPTTAAGAAASGVAKATAPTDAARLPPTLDLAEQMNEEEKRKYVKGKAL